MTQKIINLGVADKGNGDPLRTAFSKVNDNFTELFSREDVDLTNYALKSEIPADLSELTDETNLLDSTGPSDRITNGDYSLVVQPQGHITVPTSQYATAQIFSQAGVDLFIGTLDSGNFWQLKTDGSVRFPNGTAQTTAYQLVEAPQHSTGASGDKVGMVAYDNDFHYYCKADYTDGLSDIWVRAAWTGTTW